MPDNQASEIIRRLESMANPENVKGMARFGINPENTLGISVAELRRIARALGRDHALAQALWDSGIHEARILAALVDVPAQVSEAQMERWAAHFDSWDVCDQCCSNLFDKTPYAYKKAMEWSAREPEFVKRAGFVLMAMLAVHDKWAPDRQFEAFLPVIRREAADSRNFVKKAVNWALRGIGKRNTALNSRALGVAREIYAMDNKTARWIASDAIRELSGRAAPVQRHDTPDG